MLVQSSHQSPEAGEIGENFLLLDLKVRVSCTLQSCIHDLAYFGLKKSCILSYDGMKLYSRDKYFCASTMCKF